MTAPDSADSGLKSNNFWLTEYSSFPHCTLWTKIIKEQYLEALHFASLVLGYLYINTNMYILYPSTKAHQVW